MTLKLNGSNSGSVALQAPADTTGGADRVITLPDAVNGTLLTSTSGSPLQVLEEFYVPCDGTSVVTKKGTVSIENTFSAQVLETTFADVTGSSITYQPPDNTKIVIYRFTMAGFYHSADSIAFGHIFLDDVAVSDHPFVERADDNLAVVTWDHAFRIEPNLTANAATGRIQTWNSAKTIKIRARDYSSTYHAQLHYLNNASAPNSTTNTSLVCRPKIGIKAIGVAS